MTVRRDRLARRGAHVPLAFTAQPICAPTRAMLQAGLYPTTSGVYRNNVPLPRDARTLVHHFGAAGYRTGYIGKWHLANRDPVPPEQRSGRRPARRFVQWSGCRGALRRSQPLARYQP